ncbi:hypothetical protein N7520_003971 [Penicillium odoratum]|uniref:uncharacterized protein n=1 Tax=Penicillium odoratum TaxID=1167516 RepID=UPI00254746A3|nr:uncharacterized protein N7520_003971 [Penicillium odoratum]KAJ5769412.1 hypothetical protein N7520_003971 [Penicillium odoratum]
MGKTVDDRPAYLSSDDAKYSLGLHRGPLASGLSDDPKLEKVETAGGLSLATTQTRKEKFARHWKRFWCCYLIGNVIFLAIFLPVFFLVVIPAISQLVVNKSDLVLVSAAVMQPLPDTIHLTLQSALDLKLNLPVRIDPITLDLYIRDNGAANPWGQANLPGMTIRGNTTLGVTDKFTPLLNVTTWTDYVRQVVFQKETALSLKGTTDSFLGVLKSKVTMNKDVVSPTLNKFEGFSITDTSLVPTRSDGTNLVGNVTLPNPSLLTLEIGTIVLDVKSGNLTIGNATVENLTLRPGNHANPMTGTLDIGLILKNIGTVLKDQASSIKNGSLSLTSTTREVTYNGTRVPYYSTVMSELPLTADVGIVSTLKNTIKSFIGSGSGRNLTEILAELKNHTSTESGSSLLADLKEGIQSLESRDVTPKEDEDESSHYSLARALKRNVHVRDLFQDENPIKRDAMIDSLVGWVANQQ